MTVRLITADTATLSSLGYAAAVASCADIELVAQASDADEALALVAANVPDVVAIDVDLFGLELAVDLRARYPQLGILLTGPTSDDLVIKSLEAGLSGYLPRSAPVEVIMSAVRHAAVIPTSFTSPEMAGVLARRKHHIALSPREQEVFQQLNAGASLASIARRLHLTESTVRTYVARAYGKLEMHSRPGPQNVPGTVSSQLETRSDRMEE